MEQRDQQFKIGDMVYIPKKYSFVITKAIIRNIRKGIKGMGLPFFYDLEDGGMGQYPVFATYQEAEDQVRVFFEVHLEDMRKRLISKVSQVIPIGSRG